jgi:hypothetical protein
MGVGAGPSKWQLDQQQPAIQKKQQYQQPAQPTPTPGGSFGGGGAAVTPAFHIGAVDPGQVPQQPKMGGAGFGSMAQTPSVNSGNILGGAFGGGGGFGGAPPAPPGGFGAPGAGGPPGPPGTATATPDPHLSQLWQQYQDRLSSDPTQRAIDRASQSIKAQAQAQQNMADVAGAAAGRGPGYRGADISDAATRAQAGAAADISLGREQQLNQMVLGGLPLAMAQPQLALQQQGLGLQQQRLGLEEWMAPQQLGLDYMRTQASMLNPMLSFMSSMYGGGGGGGMGFGTGYGY